MIDELPNQLCETLLSEQTMSFLPVPEPTKPQLFTHGYLSRDQSTRQEVRLKKDPGATEWAQVLGLETGYEVPVSTSEENRPEKHCDLAIQTLMFPAELETRLRNLRQKAKSAVEEMGANILYLAFGFLEWFDSDDPDAKPRLAPLFLLPTNLEKGRLNKETQTYQYALSYSGEEVITNLSLREKLKHDFSLMLPELDEGTTPEDYFLRVTEMLKGNKPTWRVRRYVSLALLNFSKLLMYLDLDPKKWPSESALTEHPVVSHFLVGLEDSEQENDPIEFIDEYKIDDWPDTEEKYPLIDDADSSQHSALIDALKGQNLVIEGPPGTGKSQTITNLIASAMANGKRVLFVAEKMAALEVVKRRLDHAGLGEFCLELHSHKSSKRRVLEELQERMDRRGKHRAPREIQADIIRHEDLKRQLKAHVERINSEWGETGKSAHTILAGATRFRREVGEAPKAFHIADCTGSTFTPQRQRELRDGVRRFRDVYRALAHDLGERSVSEHPWFGIENTELQAFDREQIVHRLAEWQAFLTELANLKGHVADLLPQPKRQLAFAIDSLVGLRNALGEVPQLAGDEHLHALPKLRGTTISAFASHLELFDQLRKLHQRMAASHLPDGVANDSSQANALKKSLDELQTYAHPEVTVAGLREHLDAARMLEAGVQKLDAVLHELRKVLPNTIADTFGPDPRGLRELSTAMRLIVALKPALSAKRDLGIFDRDDFDEVFDQLRAEQAALSELAEQLGDIFDLNRLPDIEKLEAVRTELAVGGFFRWFRAKWRAARRELLSLGRGLETSPKKLECSLGDLVDFSRQRAAFLSNGRYRDLLGPLFVGLDTNVENLAALRGWFRQVRREYGVGFGPRVQIGTAILGLNEDVVRRLRAFAEQDGLRNVEKMRERLADLQRVFLASSKLHEDDALLCGEDGALPRLCSTLSNHLVLVERLLGEQQPNLEQVSDLARTAVELHETERRFNSSRIDADVFGGRLRLDSRSPEGHGVEAARRTLVIARWLEKPRSHAGIARRVYEAPSAETFRGLELARQSVESGLSREQQARAAFQALAKLNARAWGAEQDIEALIQRNQTALDQVVALDRWLDFIRERIRMHSLGCAGLCAAVESGTLSTEKLEAAFFAGTFDQLGREILRADPELARFSGTNQTSLRRQFIEYDEKLKKLQRERIATIIDNKAVPAGRGTGRVADFTEEALLRHECSKKKRHIPIRKLIERAGKALVAVKPCFMMGPMSVAQYLEPGGLSFDIIVMDEASQIKPEDALGTIARGAQVIVVGDPKQLPPTNFFAREVDVDEDTATALEESESILDATLPMFRQRRLRWHYRSQHEDLIAFSNQSFYGGDLVLFPSPHRASGDFGLHHSPVRSGVFANRRNLEEARVISEAVRNHFRHRPEETLGVVTMSAEQRDHVARSIESLAKEDPLFQQALEKDLARHEPLFTKNLENVQGDERDVVYISMTYGPNEVGGRVFQRFGPINSDVGWRRLNVLFTRSRKRLHIFTSMRSDDIIVGANSRRGVRVLRDFLAYAETGMLVPSSEEAERGPESDFEVAVAEALRRDGFECEPQVGAAGFFIDVGVRDPGNPGRFLMGIECDGASYHSAKSVRDRDRLRQQILERLGWRIRRIWSTDWFRNPEAQLGPILEELHNLKSVAPKVEEQVSESQDIEMIVEQAQQEEKSVVRFASVVGSLRDRLVRFDIEVIRPQVPKTPDDRRLLRPEMLDALCDHQPTSRPEFFESIPQYLRSGTATEEGRYLDRVFSIIASQQPRSEQDLE